MGVIDSTIYTLSCPKCGIVESASLLDKGSNWGGSHWQSGAIFVEFETKWSGDGTREPQLVLASCKVCSTAASVKSAYSS
jgi:hypothetical protein